MEVGGEVTHCGESIRLPNALWSIVAIDQHMDSDDETFHPQQNETFHP